MIARLAALFSIFATLAYAQSPVDPWGLNQMNHMLADRPVMKSFLIGDQTHWVRREDTIWQWTARHFAGEVTGFRIAWHEAPPVSTAEAMHAYSSEKAFIYIDPSTLDADLSHNTHFERLWSYAVFELLNAENAPGFSKLDWDAYKGLCTREEYAREYARLEHVALGKLMLFHKKVWLPWCMKSGFTSEPTIWRRNHQPDFDLWLSQYPKSSSYPWEYYGANFDAYRASSAQAVRKP
jgi:hypothetical protein